jgi:hypothetical protein
MVYNMPSAGRAARYSHSLFAFCLAAYCACVSAPEVWAWGRVGRRVISRFSERYLTANASAEITGILADALVRGPEPRPKEERQCRFC